MAHRHEVETGRRGWRWKLCMTGDLAIFAGAVVVAGWSLVRGGG